MKALLIAAVVLVCLALILGPAIVNAGEAAVAKTSNNMAAACASNTAACSVFTTPAITAEGGR